MLKAAADLNGAWLGHGLARRQGHSVIFSNFFLGIDDDFLLLLKANIKHTHTQKWSMSGKGEK